MFAEGRPKAALGKVLCGDHLSLYIPGIGIEGFIHSFGAGFKGSPTQVRPHHLVILVARDLAVPDVDAGHIEFRLNARSCRIFTLQNR